MERITIKLSIFFINKCFVNFDVSTFRIEFHHTHEIILTKKKRKKRLTGHTLLYICTDLCNNLGFFYCKDV